MSIDYDAIRQENIKKYGTDIDQYGPILLENPYSDQTHFIFELLQNAEDAEASQVQFRLYPDRLEFEHDGCPFNEDDVRGICRLAAGTKRNDINKIGKFGIGFKSVYAHTTSPRIHSADGHFAIDNYVQPRSIDALSATTRTLFIFPFNHADKTAEESYQTIGKRLKDLSARSLLFLRNIADISFQIEDGHSGSYERRTHKELKAGFAKIITLNDKQLASESKENWLVFEKNVARLIAEYDLADAEFEIAESTDFVVQIAFLISDFSSDGKPEIEMLLQSRLSVFFPTERETNLGFLMQGPYQTNSARDDIRKDVPFNTSLAKETGQLVVEALCWLRDREWLAVDVLNTMPLEYGKFHDIESSTNVESLFTPIYDRVLTAMKEEALIPSYDGRYISGHEAILEGSEALRNLLNGEQMQQMLGADNEMHWVMTADLTSELRRYFLDNIEIKEIDADWFVRRIDVDLMSQQSNDWVRQLYEYASVFNSRSYPHTSPFNILKQKPIIRLENKTHVAPFKNSWDDKPQAYLPTEHESRFSTVKREVCHSDRALEFLKKLGLKEPGIVDEVEKHILRKYREEQEIGCAEHMEDIGLIVQALEEDSQVRKKSLVSALKATPFLLAENAMGVSKYRKSEDIIYFRDPMLEIYFEGNPDAWFISSQYKQHFDDLEQLNIFPGVARWLRKPNRLDGHVTIRSDWGDHQRGLNGFDPGFNIDGLEFALSHPNIVRSSFIWNTLLMPRKHCILGDVARSTVKTYPSDRTKIEENVVSIAGELVRWYTWLPDRNGNFSKPCELTLDELPDEFHRDAELANALGMQISNDSPFHNLPESERRKHELVDGRSEQEVEKALALLDEQTQKAREPVEVVEPDEYPNQLEDNFEQAGSPPSAPPNPDFDSPDGDPEDRFIEDIVREPDPDERYRVGLRKIWETKNKETRRFLESEYSGECQICDSTFPKRNRAPYFEAVHLIPRTSARWLDHPRNAICLCAEHSAQFQHGERSTPDSDIIDQIRSYEGGPDHHVSIILCDRLVTARFFARHIRELCVAVGGSNYL